MTVLTELPRRGLAERGGEVDAVLTNATGAVLVKACLRQNSEALHYNYAYATVLSGIESGAATERS